MQPGRFVRIRLELEPASEAPARVINARLYTDFSDLDSLKDFLTTKLHGVEWSGARGEEMYCFVASTERGEVHVLRDAIPPDIKVINITQQTPSIPTLIEPQSRARRSPSVSPEPRSTRKSINLDSRQYGGRGEASSGMLSRSSSSASTPNAFRKSFHGLHDRDSSRTLNDEATAHASTRAPSFKSDGYSPFLRPPQSPGTGRPISSPAEIYIYSDIPLHPENFPQTREQVPGRPPSSTRAPSSISETPSQSPRKSLSDGSGAQLTNLRYSDQDQRRYWASANDKLPVPQADGSEIFLPLKFVPWSASVEEVMGALAGPEWAIQRRWGYKLARADPATMSIKYVPRERCLGKNKGPWKVGVVTFTIFFTTLPFFATASESFTLKTDNLYPQTFHSEFVEAFLPKVVETEWACVSPPPHRVQRTTGDLNLAYVVKPAGEPFGDVAKQRVGKWAAIHALA
ncbi:hypothetical protein M427DRAFT_137055 [Gonapodya prolifera JEL478]|uniref:Uncharacterized protein n=1 Tax=Gonapodya prolifera (strain JEL478) TaxID=1344416 RepID=A0A139A7R0_GONPJ|nr:hypothetical protein M427DRAFT_137055 [Gonapodya prolifera JEL478]|eukprot:KXS12729.1 hypothetical protein M427DRAFT_137055 [Gonapodya prolifera JEL478]